MEQQPSAFKRRLSLIEKPSKDKILSQRQYLRDKYYEYLRKSNYSRSIQKSISPSSGSRELTIFKTKTEGDIQSRDRVPNMRELREQRHKVGETLRQTITRYNYARHEQEKKEAWLKNKKKKYEKVMKIRQQHLKQKMELSKSRALMEKQFSEEKHKCKMSVDLERVHLDESLVKCLNEKKTIGNFIREQEKLNQLIIHEQKMRKLEENKRVYKSIKSESHKVKEVMEKVYQWKKKNVIQTQCSRIEQEIKMMASLDKKNRKANDRLKMELKSLERSEKVYEKKMKIYSETLKDGTSLNRRKQSSSVSKVNFRLMNKSSNGSMTPTSHPQENA